MTKIGHILVGDPDPDAALARCEALAEAGYRALPASEARALIELAARRRPDVVLLGVFEGEVDGLHIAEALKSADATAAIPIVLTAPADLADDLAVRRKAPTAGVDDIVASDASTPEILARLPRLIRSSVMGAELARRIATAADFGRRVAPETFRRNYPERPRVMTVSEHGDQLSDLQQILLMAGFHAIPERTAFRAGERIDDERVDAALIALSGPSDAERAAALAAHIRSNPRLFNLPTLVVGPGLDAAARERLYQAGAGIVAEGEPTPGGADAEALTAYLHMLVARQRLRWTMRDPFKATLGPETGDAELSGVYSDAFFRAHLARLLAAGEARETSLSVALIRTDNLAGVADAHGAESARILMQQMADWIAGMTRIEDACARVGPDGFALSLPETPPDEAERVVQRIVGVLHQSEFHLSEEVMEVARVWPSAGVAAREPGDDVEGLLARAAARRL
ncbi:MAG: diguanylate cyclase [Marivibrio sp.]|uniref:diguanylate cyclase domain-containing protein n=1 Tax=Marivibrio sp. TaxID=2039719 RepID=UPI0032EC30E0